MPPSGRQRHRLRVFVSWCMFQKEANGIYGLVAMADNIAFRYETFRKNANESFCRPRSGG